MTSTACIFLLMCSFGPAIYGQDAAATPSFEVADIKPSPPGAMLGKERLLPGGRIELPGGTVKMLIVASYGVQEDMVSGLPKWAENDRFDIVAKAPENTPVPTLRLMIRTLLAERFHLQFHNEEKVRQAYVLTRGKRPLKLQESSSRQQCRWTPLEAGVMRRECQGMSMAEMARQLPGWGPTGITMPVIDETDLRGTYDFHLDVGAPTGGRGDGARDGDPASASVPPDSGPTIFTALEEIGLKLESRRMPVQTIFVDRVERPGGN